VFFIVMNVSMDITLMIRWEFVIVKNWKNRKINLLACPENCDKCDSENESTCDLCNPNYPYWDQTQQKCRGWKLLVEFRK